MKKYLLLFTLFFILLPQSFADINKYQFSLLKTIPIGKEDGAIGFYDKSFGGMPSGPNGFTVTAKGEIIVPDYINLRLNVYDLNLMFIRTISEKGNKLIRAAGDLFVDDDNNIFAIQTGSGLKKIDKNGNIIFEKKWDDLAADLKSVYKVFLYKNNYFYYTENHEYACIASDGKILNTEETISLLNVLNQQNMTKTSSSILDATAKKGFDKVEQFRKDRKHLFFGDYYFETEYYKLKEFYNYTSGYYRSIAPKTLTNTENKVTIESEVLESSTLFGYDKDHNSYWRITGKEILVVLSNAGDVIDAFGYDELKDTKLNNGYAIKVSIAPSGDIYFMRNDETGSYFWKVSRRW